MVIGIASGGGGSYTAATVTTPTIGVATNKGEMPGVRPPGSIVLTYCV
jgi:hypothetical protein